MRHAAWRTPADVKAHYGSASILRDRVVFNIGGNKYRLIVLIRYDTQMVFIRFIGTHAPTTGFRRKQYNGAAPH